MNDPNDHLTDCTIFLLAKAYQRGHGLIRQRLRPYGLTNIQHVVLEALWHQQGQSAAELSRTLTLDKATLSGILERMVEAGWIVKRPDAADRRLVRLFTAPKADALKSRLIRERNAANAELLGSLRTAERLLLQRLLKDVM